MVSRVNVPKWVKGRGTTVREEERRSGTRDDGPGRGTTVRDEGQRSGTRDDGPGRGTMVWDEGRRSLLKGQNTL